MSAEAEKKRLEKEKDKHNENHHFSRSRPLSDFDYSRSFAGCSGAHSARAGNRFQRPGCKEACEKAQEGGEEYGRYRDSSRGSPGQVTRSKSGCKTSKRRRPS